MQADVTPNVTSMMTTFLMTMVGLSVATERVVETVKQWIGPSMSKYLSPARNAAVIQTIAIAAGVLVTAFSGLNPLPIKNVVAYGWNNPVSWLSWLVTGTLVSGGSAFWNHLLDILQATKVEKEQQAYGPAQSPQPVIVAQAVVAGD